MPGFFKETVLDKWGPGIAKLIGRLIVLAFTLYVGNYYFHEVYSFNADKTAQFQKVSQNFGELRTKTNELSAIINLYSSTNKKMSNKKRNIVVKLTNQIINLETKIADNTSIPYYFGEKIGEKERNFLIWVNFCVRRSLLKKNSQQEKVTDTLFYSLLYSMREQLYSPYKCKRCEILAKLTPAQLRAKIEKYTTLQSSKVNSQSRITFIELEKLKQLAINI